jgi:dihydrofolate reductase
MKSLSLIVAFAKNNVIGDKNTLPWHLPEDLKRFRALTMGHHIIMGRKTYESLGRLLPGRTTVIVTRNKAYHVEGALIVSSLELAIAMCKDDPEPFLIGGAEMYKTGLNLATKLYITEVHAEFSGDAFFEALDLTCWHEIERTSHTSENGLTYSYVVYQRLT